MDEEELNLLKNHVNRISKGKDPKEPIVLLYKLVLDLNERTEELERKR